MMELRQNTSVAVIVKRGWVNSGGVRMFVCERQEIPKQSDSHVILARVSDGGDERGLWVELNRGQREADPSVRLMGIMIPWSEVLGVVIHEDLSPKAWASARELGFVTGCGELAE